MHHRFDPHGSQKKHSIDSFVLELSKWIEEQDAWMDEVTEWDHQLRHLMVLVHELDNSLPYERQLLVNHHDVIKTHRRLLETHAGTLKRHRGNIPKRHEPETSSQDSPDNVTHDHSKQHFQHMRVRDSHLAIRFRHQQAMNKVYDLLEKFCKKIS